MKTCVYQEKGHGITYIMHGVTYSPLTFLPANVSVFKVSRVRNVIRAPVSKGELGWLVNSGLSSKTTVLEDASHFPPTLPKGLVSFPVET